jgi:hypothetical protein
MEDKWKVSFEQWRYITFVMDIMKEFQISSWPGAGYYNCTTFDLFLNLQTLKILSSIDLWTQNIRAVQRKLRYCVYIPAYFRYHDRDINITISISRWYHDITTHSTLILILHFKNRDISKTKSDINDMSTYMNRAQRDLSNGACLRTDPFLDKILRSLRLISG